jgi:hypothetical protein
MIFKTSLSKTVVVITVAITIIFAVILIDLNVNTKLRLTPVSIISSVFLLVIYFAVFAFRPLHYIVKDEAVIIKRPFTDVRLLKKNIQSVELVSKDKIKGTIRTFGVGGLFGYFGKFWNYKIGKMTWYATRANNLVLIKTIGDQNIIITPNNPENFVAAFT